MIVDLLLTVAAYLVGSLSAAIIVCKLLGLPDPRTQGSRNPGATNVLRFGGKKAAAIVLVGDSVKGLLPVLVAQKQHENNNDHTTNGLAAKHNQHKPQNNSFHGGKGVATAFGVLLG